MLLVLGGFLGSGRKLLAQEFSQRTGFYYYDMDAQLMSEYVLTEGVVRERKRRIRNNVVRLELLRRVLGEFKLLSKMHPDVVLDGSFHRKELREFFLREAGNYFDRVEFVWVESSDESAAARAPQMVGKDMITTTEEAMRRRDRAKRNFEPFATPLPTVVYEHGDKQAIDRLIELVQPRG
jgi:hypothetical protein